MQPLAMLSNSTTLIFARSCRGDQLRVQHHEGAIADQGVDFALRLRQLHAQRRVDFVSHAGVAVLHVVGVFRAVAPDALQIAWQAARRRDDHRLGRQRFIQYPKDAALGQGGVGDLAELAIHRFTIEMIVDLRHKGFLLPHRLVDALGLF